MSAWKAEPGYRADTVEITIPGNGAWPEDHPAHDPATTYVLPVASAERIGREILQAAGLMTRGENVTDDPTRLLLAVCADALRAVDAAATAVHAVKREAPDDPERVDGAVKLMAASWRTARRTLALIDGEPTRLPDVAAGARAVRDAVVVAFSERPATMTGGTERAFRAKIGAAALVEAFWRGAGGKP